MERSAKIIGEISAICKLLHSKNYLAAADGNLSFKLSDKRILITPSGVHKGFLKPKDFAVITPENKIISGNPSSERLMHLEVYRRCPKAVCVIHAHPPTAIAWSVARPDLKELPNDCLSEVILAAGRIPIVAYAQPGGPAMANALAEHLPQNRVLILARHGALSWGEDLQEAYNGMERLEHSAMILKAAHELGGLHPLSKSELAALHALRAKLGDRNL